METKIVIVTILALIAVGVLLFQILQIAGLSQQLQNSAGTATGSITASAGSSPPASSGTGQSTGNSQPSMVGGC